MDKDTIRQFFILVITTLVLYFSGNYLMTIGKLSSLLDGLVVMAFFFSLFPFLSLCFVFTGRLFKTMLSPR